MNAGNAQNNKKNKKKNNRSNQPQEVDDEADLEFRAPIVTVRHRTRRAPSTARTSVRPLQSSAMQPWQHRWQRARC